MQPRDGLLSTELTVSSGHESDDSRMWYVRLRIRDDRLAKIWAWNLAEHDAIVWSDDEERWKQLLAVPELRAAVRKETTSAFVRKRTTSDAPPSAAALPQQPTLLHIEVEDAPTQAQASAARIEPQEDNEPTRIRLFASSDFPAPVDPLLQALTTSIPPAVISNPAPEIPRAPRLPSFERAAATESVRVAGNAQQLLFGSRSRGRLRGSFGSITANLTLKNVAWALLPVIGASVFAFVLLRNSEPTWVGRHEASANTADGTILEWLLDERQLAEKLATKLVGAPPVCSGQPQVSEPSSVSAQEQSSSNLEQERKVVTRAGQYKSSSVLATRGAVRDKAQGASAKSGVATPVAVSNGNEFDRDAARTALRFAIARARNCSNAGVSGSVLVTFAPSGTAQSVQISQLVGDDVEPSCISRAFSMARVPPFGGNAVTVRKTF